MERSLENPWRTRGGLNLAAPMPVDDASAVTERLGRCPRHAPTPLLSLPELAADLGLKALWIKDERGRMGLGSFKALGAAHAIACDAEAADAPIDQQPLRDRVYITASAGNHGLSVAAGARVFGARAVVVLAETVPESFAERLRARGAEVHRSGRCYEDSMAAAADIADREGWTLLSDSSWPGYSDAPLRVMEGYLQLAAEAAQQIPEPPSHIVVQAGVGGLAAAVAAHARRTWGDAPAIIVVEPEEAPALIAAIAAGQVVDTEGTVSCMGRLDCKTASLIALNGLARDADRFVTVSEAEAEDAVRQLAALGLETTPSGAAGVAALMSGLDVGYATVMVILSE